MPKYKFSEFAYNITQKRMPQFGDEELYIGLEHLDSGSLSVKRWGSDVPITGEKLVMKKGDILFGRRNTYLKRAAIAPHDGLFSAHGMILKPNTKVMDPDYFPFFISSDYFMDAAIRISVGSLSPTVNWKTLKDLEFEIPDLVIQKEKAELLKAANDLKESYERLLSKTDDLVKSQFVEMFGGTLHEDKLINLCHFIDYRGKTPAKADSGLPFITAKNVRMHHMSMESQEYISKETYDQVMTRGFPKVGDVVFTTEAPMGYVCRIPPIDTEFYIGQRIITLQTEKLVPTYLEYALSSERFQAQLNAQSSGSTVTGIKSKLLEQMIIPVPEINLQKQFAAFVDQTDKSKLELGKAIIDIDDLMKSIIQAE